MWKLTEELIEPYKAEQDGKEYVLEPYKRELLFATQEEVAKHLEVEEFRLIVDYIKRRKEIC